jgi:hypothetical protein
MSHKKAKASRAAKSVVKDGSAIKLTLAPAARSAVVSAFATAMTTNETGGSLLTTVCKTAAKFMRGKPIPDADQDAIANDLAVKRGWSEESKGPRISEVKAVLSVYSVLPDAIDKLGESGAATYFMGLALARKIKKGKTVKAAIKEIREGGTGEKANPVGRLATALYALYKASKGDKRKAVVRMARIAKDDCGAEFRGDAGKVF